MSGGATSSCLTEAQLRAVQASPPGEVPSELALHLASCERCQERVLFGARSRAAGRAARAELPSLRKTLLLAALVLLAMAGFFYTLLKLFGRVQ